MSDEGILFEDRTTEIRGLYVAFILLVFFIGWYLGGLKGLEEGRGQGINLLGSDGEVIGEIICEIRDIDARHGLSGVETG